jgi:hypothetical protein
MELNLWHAIKHVITFFRSLPPKKPPKLPYTTKQEVIERDISCMVFSFKKTTLRCKKDPTGQLDKQSVKGFSCIPIRRGFPAIQESTPHQYPSEESWREGSGATWERPRLHRHRSLSDTSAGASWQSPQTLA